MQQNPLLYFPEFMLNCIIWQVVLPDWSINPLTLQIEPLKVESLKQACIKKLEDLILSGELKIGEKLPSERSLADELHISRPVLHEALVELNARGLVAILPRRGVFINDYRTTGSCALLTSLLDYNDGKLDPAFIHSMLEMRILVETETARLAAERSTKEQLNTLAGIAARETSLKPPTAHQLTELDFEFHLNLAIASGNLIYPLILNSFKNVYTHLTGLFFQQHLADEVTSQVFDFHSRLIQALAAHDPAAAAKVMTEMLQHGEKNLCLDN